ncbi:MAG: response regulator transcription factor [Bacteroidota bacterium]
MKKINILVADHNFLVRSGFRSMINGNAQFNFAGEAKNPAELHEKLCSTITDVLIIDYTSPCFCTDDVIVIKEHFPEIRILAITHSRPKEVISEAIAGGVTSHVLKECDKEEIEEAIRCTGRGEPFFCGKIINALFGPGAAVPARLESVSCDGVKISPREVEVIRHIARGLSNKEIAGKLFLSVHTVTTHRKNIMSKLGVNNSAGLIMYAIRKNIIASHMLPADSKNVS